jgi:hypothetical protein
MENPCYDFPIFRDWMKGALAGATSGIIFRDLLDLYTPKQPERWTQYMPNGVGVSHLKLHLCVTPWKTVQSLTTTQTTELESVRKTFETNLNRVHAFTVFPPAIVNTTKILCEIRASAIFDNRLSLLNGKISEAEVNSIIEQRVQEHADKRAKIITAGGQQARDLLQGELAFGFEAMNSFLKDELASAAHAWLSAQITGIWTAFESMAEELWVTAMNLHPRILAELRGSKRSGGDDKKIDLFLLQMHGYNLSSKMGDVLRRRYLFDKLEEIRQAYADAFSDDADDIKNIINDKFLDALALTRHVIVHNGGIIDAAFLKRKNDLPTAIIGNIGDPLPLDGDVTATLIGPVMQLGWNLLTLVDQWLAGHPS